MTRISLDAHDTPSRPGRRAGLGAGGIDQWNTLPGRQRNTASSQRPNSVTSSDPRPASPTAFKPRSVTSCRSDLLAQDERARVLAAADAPPSLSSCSFAHPPRHRIIGAGGGERLAVRMSVRASAASRMPSTSRASGPPRGSARGIAWSTARHRCRAVRPLLAPCSSRRLPGPRCRDTPPRFRRARDTARRAGRPARPRSPSCRKNGCPDAARWTTLQLLRRPERVADVDLPEGARAARRTER